MSQKQVKADRKAKEADWIERRDSYLKEGDALSEKYRCDLRPQLSTIQTGPFTSENRATIVVVDTIEHYEHVENPKEKNA